MEKLSKEVLEKVDELVSLIKESSDYKRYLELNKKMKEDKEIIELVNEIKNYQKLIVNMEYRKENTKEYEEKINYNLEKLNTFPIYLEYSYLQEDLNNLFQDIKKILENHINEVVK